jgi:glucoamylase
MSLDTPEIHRRLAAVGKTLDIPDSPADIRREAYLSAVVLKVHQDRAYPGSIVASLSVPWGNSTDSIGGYHLVWPRDCVEAGLALLGVGQIDDARSMLSYLIAIQNQDGGWNQNCFPDGRPFWVGIQLTKSVFPSSSPPSSRNKMHCADWVAWVP